MGQPGGEEEALGAEPGGYTWVRVSPDGAQLALDFDGDVQTYDTVRGTFNRVTTDPATDRYPLWTVDGEYLVFESARGGSPELFWTRADGTGSPTSTRTIATTPKSPQRGRSANASRTS